MKKTITILLTIVLILATRIVTDIWMDGNLCLCGMTVLICSMALWLTESLPMAISTLLMICFLPFLKIESFSEAISGFGTNTSLFIMASTGITVAVAKSNIPKCLMTLIINRANGNMRALVIVLGVLVGLFSAFMSSLAVCMLFYSLLFPVLKNNGIKPKESNLGKDIMMVIPACAGIGGFMTPAGTPANFLVLNLLEREGVYISFAQWSCIGFPIGMAAILIYLCSMLAIYKPEAMNVDVSCMHIRLNKRDKRIAIIIICIIAGWFAGGFVEGLDITLVALLGLVVMMIPSFKILSFEEFCSGVNWDLVLTMGGVSILMTAVSKTDVINTIAQGIFVDLAHMPMFWHFLLVNIFVCGLRAFIPTTTAVIALFAPILQGVANLSGIRPELYLLPLAYWAAADLLLVYTEPIYLITYKSGYYTERNLFGVGIIPTILYLVCGSVLLCLLML